MDSHSDADIDVVRPLVRPQCALAGDRRANGIASRLTLFNAVMTQLLLDTIDGRGSCSQIDGTGQIGFKDAAAHNLAAGTYYLRVDSVAAVPASQFDYRLVVTVRAP